MTPLNFRSLDLNLLRVLAAIHRTGSVTAAGKALALSQPATSNALARLRDYFADDLFVRSPAGLKPTRLCERIAPDVAAWLQAQGVARGDRVLLDMQNCPQLVAAHFGILRANAVVVPVNPMSRVEELKHYITDPDVRVAITTSDLAPELARASDALPQAQRLQHLLVTHFTDDLDPGAAHAMPAAWRDWLLARHAHPALAGGQVHAWQDLPQDAVPPPLQTGAADLALLPYTSGTTGLPKGCMHLHKSIMHNAVASSLWGNGSADNVTLAVVPMFHITGMVSVMHTSICAAPQQMDVCITLSNPV
eukprot:gene43474-53997_t